MEENGLGTDTNVGGRKLSPVQNGLKVPGAKIGPRRSLTLGVRRSVPSLPRRMPARPAAPVAPSLPTPPAKPAPPSVKTRRGSRRLERTPVHPQGSPGQKESPEAKVVVHRGLKMPFFFFSRRYRPLSQMKHSGLGQVFRAHDIVLNTDVALKFLPLQALRDAEGIALLKKEAALAMRLSHENIVRLHNVETENGRLFLVMEFVDGEDLREILQRMGPLSLATVAAIAESCAAALDYAHKQGVLHRDLKPENIMLDRENALKIVDFGTASLAHKSGHEPYIEGTPSYMSPEQIRGEALDARTDVFSLGAVLSELLTGTQAFPFRNDWAQLEAMQPVGLSSLPPAVAEALSKAMAKKRDDRWTSAGELAEAFGAAVERA